MSTSMEIDNVEAEAGPSTPTSSTSQYPSPLSFNLAAACRSLCEDCGATDATQALSLGLNSIVINAAFDVDPRSTSVAQLSNDLSQLLSQSSTAPLVIRHFGPVLLHLLAPWLDTPASISLDLWEQRLPVVASLASLRPDLWRLVDREMGSLIQADLQLYRFVHIIFAF